MPKPKPDRVVRHEIILGRTEREMLDTVITANAANRIMTPLVALMSDASAMLVLLSILEVFGITDILPNDLRQQLESGVYGTWQDFETQVIDPLIEAGGELGADYQRIKKSKIVKLYYTLKDNLPAWAEFGKL